MKKNTTKRSLLASLLALVMCVTMLVGTTFAWFTDSASTAVNKIQAGKLKIELQYATAWDAETGEPTAWEDAEGKTLNFRTVDGRTTNILWEPGCTYTLPELRIVNKGDLALKYKIYISGIAGDAELNDAINWSYMVYSNFDGMYAPRNGDDLTRIDCISGEMIPGVYGDMYGDATNPIVIKGEMRTDAGNEYQGLTIDGIGITVYATQYTHENDSESNQYDKDAAYPTGASIIGLNGTYDTLTAAAKAWRESKGIVTSGGNMGGHPADLTSVDTISWIISGSVGSGDGAGVVGTSGCLLSGGYIHPSIAVKNIYVKGVNNAELKNEIGADYAFSAGAKNTENVVYDGVTFPEFVSFNINVENVTFKNCTFKGGLKVMQAINVTVDNCKFEGDGTKDYAFFAQAVPADSMKTVQFTNNTVSGFMRGINATAGSKAAVTISGNTITNITGKTGSVAYGSAIQLTSAKTFVVTDNAISNVAVNALHIWASDDGTQKCEADSIVIRNNTISAKYLCWNQAEYDMTKVTSAGNDCTDIEIPNKCCTKTEEIPSAFLLN